MSEHIGTANYPRYFNKINSLLRDRGLVLNHAIARRAKATKRQAKKIRPERKFLLKYIFPGSELIPVGTTTDTLENTGFEVHDVESLREHYALTLKYWSKNLTANKEEAIRLVGPEKYRLWAAYMTGGSVGFTAGSIKIYQVLASKRASKGLSGLPPTRADLYPRCLSESWVSGSRTARQNLLAFDSHRRRETRRVTRLSCTLPRTTIGCAGCVSAVMTTVCRQFSTCHGACTAVQQTS